MVRIFCCVTVPKGIDYQFASPALVSISPLVIFSYGNGFVIAHRSSGRRIKGHCAFIGQSSDSRVISIVPNGSRIDKYVR